MASKKGSDTYTADHAALAGRTLKTGQSRCYVGYKKHTLRVWLPTLHPSVTLVPLVSWITPANVAEGGLLLPSLRWCLRHLGWWPGIVVADMGYLSAPGKHATREGLQTAVVTKLRADMKRVSPYASATTVECPQGQRLEWWEYELLNRGWRGWGTFYPCHPCYPRLNPWRPCWFWCCPRFKIESPRLLS